MATNVEGTCNEATHSEACDSFLDDKAAMEPWVLSLQKDHNAVMERDLTWALWWCFDEVQLLTQSLKL